MFPNSIWRSCSQMAKYYYRFDVPRWISLSSCSTTDVFMSIDSLGKDNLLYILPVCTINSLRTLTVSNYVMFTSSHVCLFLVIHFFKITAHITLIGISPALVWKWHLNSSLTHFSTLNTVYCWTTAVKTLNNSEYDDKFQAYRISGIIENLLPKSLRSNYTFEVKEAVLKNS